MKHSHALPCAFALTEASIEYSERLLSVLLPIYESPILSSKPRSDPDPP